MPMVFFTLRGQLCLDYTGVVRPNEDSACNNADKMGKLEGFILTKCGSSAQTPTGTTNFCALISLNPAPFRYLSRRGPGLGSNPAVRDAWRNAALTFARAELGRRVLSGERQRKSKSRSSVYPLRAVNLWGNHGVVSEGH